jgi:serine phosphatase RsbU (regulator of sigma subunit)
MTCFASLYDPAAHAVTFANAGHGFPLVLRGETGALDSFIARGSRLGEPKPQRFKIGSGTLAPTDTVLWFTDGLVESVNADGEEFGYPRLYKTLRRARGLEPQEVCRLIVTEVESFRGDVLCPDDVTLVVGRVAGSGQA